MRQSDYSTAFFRTVVFILLTDDVVELMMMMDLECNELYCMRTK